MRTKLVNAFRRLLYPTNNVYQLSGPVTADQRSDCVFVRFSSPDQVCQQVRNSIAADGNQARLETDMTELAEGSRMWVAFIDGHPVSVVFVRPAGLYKQWLLQLQPQDLVVFRLRTDPSLRGRGLAPSLIRACLSAELQSSGSAWVDCRPYNTASIRCLQKTGFCYVGRRKPISRADALGLHPSRGDELRPHPIGRQTEKLF